MVCYIVTRFKMDQSTDDGTKKFFMKQNKGLKTPFCRIHSDDIDWKFKFARIFHGPGVYGDHSLTDLTIGGFVHMIVVHDKVRDVTYFTLLDTTVVMKQ